MMINYVIIMLVLIGLSVHRYLSVYWQERRLPYDIGFLLLTQIFCLLYLVAFVWMFGLIVGIIVAALCYFQIVYSAVLWLTLLPLLTNVRRNLALPPVNAFVYGIYPRLIAVLGLLTVVNVFVTPYMSLWNVVRNGGPWPIAVLLLVMVLGNVTRVAAASKTSTTLFRLTLFLVLGIGTGFGGTFAIRTDWSRIYQHYFIQWAYLILLLVPIVFAVLWYFTYTRDVLGLRARSRNARLHLWRQALVNAEIDLGSDEDGIISTLLIPDDISIDTFVSNYAVLRGMSIRVFFGIDEPTRGSPSLHRFAGVHQRAPLFPLWFVAAYPDVLAWFHDSQKQYLAANNYVISEEVLAREERLWGAAMENFDKTTIGDVVGSDGKARYPLLRSLIDSFLTATNRRPETSSQRPGVPLFEIVVTVIAVGAIIAEFSGWSLAAMRVIAAFLFVLFGLSSFPFLKEDRHKIWLAISCIVFVVCGVLVIVIGRWWPLTLGGVLGFGLVFFFHRDRDLDI